MSMSWGDLTHAERARLKPHLPKSRQRGGRWASHRRVINGILYRLRTGAPWRDLPARFGPWKTVYERHRRSSADGTWDGIFAAVLADADAEGRIDGSTGRLVDGERRFDLLPGPSARRRGS
jgi:transposase